MPRHDERWQFNSCLPNQLGGPIVRGAQRVVNFDVPDERRRADLVGVE
jgi:hypothetical protein